MNRLTLVLPLAVLGVVGLSCSPTRAQSDQAPPPERQPGPRAQIDAGSFYDDLAPYGDWVEMPEYGWTFAPHVDSDWRPYTRGQWEPTDDGWYWDSDEGFGWATYHYGRWFNDPYYGWVWIPGDEWAPAWVSWRYGNGYTGWAPLPPRADWQAQVGLRISGLDLDAFIGARDYNFVEDRAFVDRGVYQRLLPKERNVTIISVTNNVTRYTITHDRVANLGIPLGDVERALGRDLPRRRTVDRARADAPRVTGAGEIAVYRPRVNAAPERRPSRGSSLIKGEAPPAFLMERRRQREQERPRGHREAEVTAKEASQQPAGIPRPEAPPQRRQDPLGTEPRPEPGASEADAQRVRDRAQQGADAERNRAAAQRVRDQEVDRRRAEGARDAQAQAEQRARDAERRGQPRAAPSPTSAPQPPKGATPPESATRVQREQERQQPDPLRIQAQEARRLEQEKRRAADQQRLEQERGRRDKAAEPRQEPPRADPAKRNEERPNRERDPQADKSPRPVPPDEPARPKDKGHQKNAKPTPTPAH